MNPAADKRSAKGGHQLRVHRPLVHPGAYVIYFSEIKKPGQQRDQTASAVSFVTAPAHGASVFHGPTLGGQFSLQWDPIPAVSADPGPSPGSRVSLVPYRRYTSRPPPPRHRRNARRRCRTESIIWQYPKRGNRCSRKRASSIRAKRRKTPAMTRKASEKNKSDQICKK